MLTFFARFQIERHTEKELEALFDRANDNALSRDNVEPAEPAHRPYQKRNLGVLAALLAPILKLT